MVISIVIGALGIVFKGLGRGLKQLEVRGHAETIQTTALIRSASILRRVLETWGDLQSFRLSDIDGVKKYAQRIIIITPAAKTVVVVISILYEFPFGLWGSHAGFAVMIHKPTDNYNNPYILITLSLFYGISTFVGYLMPKPFS